MEIATLDDPKAPYIKIPGCDVHAFGPTPDRTHYHFNPELEKWLRTNYQRFDGIIVNGVWQYHGLAVRRVAAGRRPYVVFAHGMLDPYFMRRFPLKHLKKLGYWMLCERKNLDLAQAVCFTSEEEMRIAAEGFPSRNHFKRVVVPYGTIGPSGEPESLKRAFLGACPAVAGKRYLLFLGRLHPKKGCDLLLEAYARIPCRDIDLVMVGPDEAGWGSEFVPGLPNWVSKTECIGREHFAAMRNGGHFTERKLSFCLLTRRTSGLQLQMPCHVEPSPLFRTR